MSDEWGPWIEHDGRGCPVQLGQHVEVEGHHVAWGNIMRRDGVVTPHELGHYCWIQRHPKHGPCVIRYRIRRPRALQKLVELVETLPAPEPKIAEPV